MSKNLYPTFKDFTLIETKDLTGKEPYELLKYVDSSRTRMLLILHMKGSRGGAYFGGDMHDQLMKTPEHVSGFWNLIKSEGDFRALSDQARDQIREIIQSTEPDTEN